MNENLKTILYAVGFAIAALFLANAVSFLLDILKNGLPESWSFAYEKGVFTKNGKPMGVLLGSSKGNGLMTFAFLYAILRAFRKGKLRFK